MGNLRAYLISAAAFFFLCGIIALLYIFRVFASFNAETYFPLAVLAVIALITVIVFQSFRVSRDAESMAEGLATRIANDFLSKSQELFSQLYRSSPVPYILIDQNGTIASTNMSAVRLFDITEGELDTTNVFDMMESDDPQGISLILGKLDAGLFVNDQELRIKRKDGTTRWTLCSLFSFKDPSGGRKGLLTLVDISKQKQIDQAKTEFVSLASHQLRTPIAAMKWNLELLMMKYKTTLVPEAAEFVEKAMESIKQMNLLVGDFLNASRFELGTLKYEKSTFELVPFIEAIFKENMSAAQAKRLVFDKRYDEHIATINSDQRLLQMIVNNLISNAIKYTPENGTVSLTTSLGSGTILIRVSDTGMGIPKDEQDRLFTKIFRASNATASVPDGTGLGLYIASQAAKVLGGSIACESELNEGATFIVTLPAS